MYQTQVLPGFLCLCLLMLVGAQGISLNKDAHLSRNKRTPITSSTAGNVQYDLLNAGKWYTYKQARELCQAAGKQLVAPRNQAEMNALTSIDFTRYAWLEINDVVKEGRWVFIDGTPVTWSNWNDLEPNNLGESGEDCALTNKSGKWIDVPCNVVYGSAVCQSVDENYFVEILFVVEPQLVREYQGFGYTTEETARTQIEGDLKYFIFELNKVFRTMSDLKLGLRIKHVSFTSGELFTSDDLSNGQLIADSGYKKFWPWLTTNEAYATYQYDVALVLTGYKLTGGNVYNSYVESACNSKWGVGIVYSDGTFGSATNINWALGTLLGISGCSSGEYSFNSCAENKMKSFIQSLINKQNNCFAKTTTKPPTFTEKDVRNRDVVNRDKACKRALNDKTGFFCSYPYTTGVPNGICTTLWCGKSGTHTCFTATSSEGMICDTNKRCNLGKCLAAPSKFHGPGNNITSDYDVIQGLLSLFDQ